MKASLAVPSAKAILCFLAFYGATFAQLPSAQSQSTGALTLSWGANTESDLAGYKIYRSTTPGVYSTPIAIVPKNASTYGATSLQLHTRYYFVVSAFDTSGNESAPSNEASGAVTTSTQPVTVPNVIGMAQAAAQAALETARLVTGKVIVTTHPNTPKGKVINQVPSVGTTVAPSSAVDLVVSSGASASGTVSQAPDQGGDGGGGGCFIATAAFGSPLAEEVTLLRVFRDRYLMSNGPGRMLVAVYYTVSPPLARVVADHDTLRAATRAVLAPIFWWAGTALVFPLIAAMIGMGLVGAGVMMFIILLRLPLFLPSFVRWIRGLGHYGTA